LQLPEGSEYDHEAQSEEKQDQHREGLEPATFTLEAVSLEQPNLVT